MAQVGHLELVGAPAAQAPLPPTPMDTQSPPEVDMVPEIAPLDSSAIRESTQQNPLAMEEVRAESSKAEDDDVQIIFCAPRRRKKRRKRLESAHSTSPLSQISVPPIDDLLPKTCDAVLQDPPRRRSTGVVNRLESCHIGDENEISGRAGSLPSIPCAPNSYPNEQYPWFAEPNYCNTSPAHFPSLADSTAWWDHSLPTLQPRPFLNIPWRPLPMESMDSKKRKHDGEFDEECPRSAQPRESVQMSPRTNPLPTRAPSGYPPYQINPNNFDMYGYSDQSQPSPMSWPNYGWNSFETPSSAQFASPPPRPMIPMDLSLPDYSTPENSPAQQPRVSNRYEHSERRGPWQHQAEQMAAPPRQSQGSGTSLREPPVFSSTQSQNLQRQPSPGVVVQPRPRPSISFSTPMALDVINAPRAPIPVAAQPLVAPTNSVRVLTSPIPPRAAMSTMPSADILRRPSLYSIPPWPSASTSPPVTPGPPSQPHISYPVRNPNTLRTRVMESSRSFADPTRPISPIVTRTSDHTMRSPASSGPARSPTPALSQPGGSEFQIPDARMGRKHSPNLIVDIAETCQEMFPFAAVAERHDVAIQKVFDTFSAIIQLPLLRNADDRRRHGSLGKRRTKEYRDAKRAMQKAQEDERKTEMKAMRARVEDAARSKDQVRNSGLLKSAVLNNARDVQGGR
ncbi:hypothetical protein LZ554_005726 [Drepanopeziza brunnea f. sp. 'monogermtubi']|nr:hypothetical protein LZ554_005726 [Drepanopeziza brunnea f. sp. 'monogermtubi']